MKEITRESMNKIVALVPFEDRRAVITLIADVVEQTIDEVQETIMARMADPRDYCEKGMSSCRCGWQGKYPLSGCPECNHSFVS